MGGIFVILWTTSQPTAFQPAHGPFQKAKKMKMITFNEYCFSLFSLNVAYIIHINSKLVQYPVKLRVKYKVTTIINMSLSDNSYFLEIQRFVEWCHANFLTLNVSKTKEIIIDFRLLKEIPPPVIINEQSVEIVHKYKYLGLVIDFKLNWNEHVNILIKRLNQRLYFLRRLRSFNFSSNSLKMFYLSIIESIICFGISCWGNSITSNDKNRINKIIKKAAKITNNELCCFQELYQKCCYKKFKIISEDPTHPIYSSFIRSSRSGRFLQPAARTERYGNSFVCSSVRISRELTAPR